MTGLQRQLFSLTCFLFACHFLKWRWHKAKERWVAVLGCVVGRTQRGPMGKGRPGLLHANILLHACKYWGTGQCCSVERWLSGTDCIGRSIAMRCTWQFWSFVVFADRVEMTGFLRLCKLRIVNWWRGRSALLLCKERRLQKLLWQKQWKRAGRVW